MIANYKDTQITIEKFTSTTNEWGEPIENWTPHIHIMGRISPKSSQERFESAKTTLFSDYRLYCDIADIKETDRVVEGSNIYNVIGIMPRKKPFSGDGFMEIDLELVK